MGMFGEPRSTPDPMEELGQLLSLTTILKGCLQNPEEAKAIVEVKMGEHREAKQCSIM